MSNPETAYKALLSEYLKIKETDFIGMNREREVIIGESLKLASYSKEDLPQFETIPRFNPELIAFLPERIDGFIYAADQFFFAEELPAKALAEWDAIDPEAQALKKKILNRRYTIAIEEGDLTTAKTMKKVAIGQGRYDTCSDFSKLNIMAKMDTQKLASIGITPAEIKRLDELDTKFKSLIGNIDRKPEGLEEKKNMMFRAYTYLALAVNPICEYGQMIFEGTDRAELYKSETLSKNASGSRKSTDTGSETASPDMGIGL